MTNPPPDQAFILAAGFGTRLRPHTLNTPKPLITVNNTTLLDHTLNHLSAAGVTKTAINTHYLADQIHQHVQTRTNPEIIISHETEILDTGGGIKQAQTLLDDKPFYILSGDGYWHNPQNGHTSLEILAKAWNPDTMDILMLLQPTSTMITTKGIGDYTLSQNGQATRSHNKTGTHMFTSMRIHHPRALTNMPNSPFSYLKALDQAEKAGRLYGISHTGIWHHISTPEDLESVRKAEKNA